ncbi:MAG: hypothetical protein WEB03_14730 [Nitriliruptor sp.]|uniref:hypothetical protein n=1 Tax=Nitriliruptor sp. TaxID=2448056 RepID=UPI0034A091F3
MFAQGCRQFAEAQAGWELVGEARADLRSIASQQLSNDLGGDRWVRLIDDVDMYVDHVHARALSRPTNR